MNDIIYKVGDNVIIKGENGESYMASIKSLYEDTTMTDPNRAMVCWYFESKELPSKVKRLIKNLEKCDKELFVPLPDANNTGIEFSLEDVDAETFESLCKIKMIGVHGRIPLELKETEYVVRYGFTKKGELHAADNYMLQIGKSEKEKAKNNGKQKMSGQGVKTPSKQYGVYFGAQLHNA